MSNRLLEEIGAETNVPPGGPASSPGLASALVDQLNRHELPYCHWKSNIHLARAWHGDTDLDLLVDRRCLGRVFTILSSLGFKPAAARWGPASPGIYHFYGMDPASGRFVHVHLFRGTLTGESFVKSHLLPLDKMLLENVDQMGAVIVPSRPAELVVFVLRTFIKHGSWLDLLHLRNEAASLKAELAWLQSDHGTDEAVRLLRQYCPVIDESLFAECIAAVEGPSSLLTRVRLARRVRRRLRVYATRRSLPRALAYARTLGGYAWRRLMRKKNKKSLLSGGAVIAFTGPEATGKSTLVSECGRWLEDALVVRTVHGGKPPSAWLTLPVNAFRPFLRRVLPRLRTAYLEGHKGGDAGPSPSTLPQRRGVTALVRAFSALITAWDRRALLIKARRAAAHGEIVICDRYPSEVVGAMDSRRLEQDPVASGVMHSIYNRLARIEERLYQDIAPPDVVLRLHVSVETATKRNLDRIKKGKETTAYLQSRHRKNTSWRGVASSGVHDIDTERDLDETILAAKTAIWTSL